MIKNGEVIKMSVNSYLEQLASSLVLAENEKEHIKISVNAIKSRIYSYFSDIEDIIVFGSYSRDTILPRKADEKSDVDIMVVFKNFNFYKPQAFINRLKAFAEYYYKKFRDTPIISNDCIGIKSYKI